MAAIPAISASGAVVIDASTAVAICSREPLRNSNASAELNAYSTKAYLFYAPGVLFSETLYVLCQKRANGLLSKAEHAQAIIDFELLMAQILPPPSGDKSLIQRANAITAGYGCSRSADALYIALAEELAASMPTTILTFDTDMPNQAAANAPSVTVQVLSP